MPVERRYSVERFETRLDAWITGGGDPDCDESPLVHCLSCAVEFNPELDYCPECHALNPIIAAIDADNEYDPTRGD